MLGVGYDGRINLAGPVCSIVDHLNSTRSEHLGSVVWVGKVLLHADRVVANGEVRIELDREGRGIASNPTTRWHIC